jgi:hypothetical protein
MYNVTHNKTGFRNSYCGPAALSAIAGITAEQAAMLLRHVGGRRAICSTYDHEMVRALSVLGLKIEEQHVVGTPTVKRWKKPKGKLLVAVTGHYIAVQSGKFWDSFNNSGTSLKKIARKQVHKVWVLKGRVNKKVIHELEAPKKKAKKANTNYRNKVKKFCEENNCELDIMGGFVEVAYPKGKVDGHDCHYTSTDRSDWENAAEMWEYLHDRVTRLEDCTCEECTEVCV